MRDAVAAWRDPELHARAALCHFENMLSNALDGSLGHLAMGDLVHPQRGSVCLVAL